MDASDILGRRVGLAAFDLPTGATFADNGNDSGQLRWTPASAQIGQHQVRIVADNGAGDVETIYLSLIVIASNDRFETPVVLETSAAGVLVGTITLATKQAGEPGYYGGRSVWFRFTAVRTERLVFEASSDTFDPRSGVYVDATPNSPPAFSELVDIVNTDGWNGDPVRDQVVVLDAAAGQTYYLVIEGYGYQEGAFQLGWRTAELVRVLWRHTNGAVTIWTLDDAGRIIAHPMYGPFDGWQAVKLAVGKDGQTRILWSHTSGKASVWTLNSAGQLATSFVSGPYGSLRASDLAVRDEDGQLHVAWTDGAGRITLREMTANASTTTGTAAYGPFYGWTPISIGMRTELYRLTLWRKVDGLVALWAEPWDYGNPNQTGIWGPYPDWTPVDLAAGNRDGSARLLWRHSSGAVGFWRVLPDWTVTTASHGPFPGWEPIAVAASHVVEDQGDDYTRVLWRHVTGAISIWKTNAGGHLVRGSIFGPFDGWSVVDIAVGPE